MNKIDEHIQERLDGFYENNYTTITTPFLLQFGPYISMTSGYETRVDAIAKKDDLMRFFQYAAYIIRGFDARCNSGKSDKEIREFLRECLIEVSKEFTELRYKNLAPDILYSKYRDALIHLIETCNSKTLKRSTESVMTNICPIVPYSQQLERRDLGFGEPATETSDDMMEISDNAAGIKQTLFNILLEVSSTNNLESIMRASDLTTYSSYGVDGIHDIMTRYRRGPVRDYYVLALIYYIAPTDDALMNMINLHTHMESLVAEESYSQFEATINAYAKRLEGIMEDSWEDLSIEGEDETVVNKLVSTAPITRNPDDNPSFDMDAIYNFIALNRYMQFDEWSRRLYLDNFKDKDDTIFIVNINKLGKNIIAYELNTDLLVIPYTDLRDYKVRYIYLRRNEPVPFIDSKFLTK